VVTIFATIGVWVYYKRRHHCMCLFMALYVKRQQALEISAQKFALTQNSSNNAERQERWRNARVATEQRVEVLLPMEVVTTLKDLAEKRGVSLWANAAQYIERCLVRANRLQC
jgi:hypothetical protein